MFLTMRSLGSLQEKEKEDVAIFLDTGVEDLFGLLESRRVLTIMVLHIYRSR